MDAEHAHGSAGYTAARLRATRAEAQTVVVLEATGRGGFGVLVRALLSRHAGIRR